MASDEDYASFLDKANQDTGASTASTASRKVTTTSVNTEVPQTLQQVEAYYESEADEPFEPVSLKWEAESLPTEGQFKQLVGHEAEVSTLSAEEFDPRGQYKEVIDPVKDAGTGQVKIFRVQHGSTRAEYYIVSLDVKGKKVVGLKASAVET